jgi:hypothetical protein
MQTTTNSTPTFSHTDPTGGRSVNIFFAKMEMVILEEPEARRPEPSAKAMRVMKRLANENRTPQRWYDSSDDPTIAD